MKLVTDEFPFSISNSSVCSHIFSNKFKKNRIQEHSISKKKRLCCGEVSYPAGEGQEGVVDSFIQAALRYYGDKGQLDNSPLPILLEHDKDSRLTSSPLRYPGKLAADIAGDRLFIADSNNNRS